MKIGILIVALSVVGTLGVSDETNVAPFLPGAKMVFPMLSDGVLEDLGARLVASCKQAASESDCLARVESRIESCKSPLPPVFETDAQYRKYAEEYLSCVVPRPTNDQIGTISEAGGT